MTPIDFPGFNTVFGPPPDMTETQVRSVKVYAAPVRGGSCDGSTMIVLAYMPEPHELERIKEGGPIFLTCLGGLPPHFLSTSFAEACNPA